MEKTIEISYSEKTNPDVGYTNYFIHFKYGCKHKTITFTCDDADVTTIYNYLKHMLYNEINNIIND